MAKWADYGISHVGMDKGETRIESVRVYIYPRDKFDATKYYDVSRKFVLNQLDNKNAFVTIRMVHGQWVKGDAVHPLKVGNTRYIRTDGNSIAADNLGNLPKL